MIDGETLLNGVIGILACILVALFWGAMWIQWRAQRGRFIPIYRVVWLWFWHRYGSAAAMWIAMKRSNLRRRRILQFIARADDLWMRHHPHDRIGPPGPGL